MDNQGIFLSIVIPAYNEGGRKGDEFRKNFQQIADYFEKKNLSYEVIVVNDGSKDNTAEFVKGIAPIVKNFHLIDRKENRGKWFSVREGFLAAKGKFALLTDADAATAIDNLEGFLPHLEKGEDVVIGSRDLKEAKIEKHQPKWKEFLGDAGNIFIQFIVGLRGIEDTQCGFKTLSRKAIENIVPMMKVDRWGGDFEMLMLAKKFKYKITEVPVIWVDAGQSLVNVRAYINTFKELFQVRWRMMTGQYRLKK